VGGVFDLVVIGEVVADILLIDIRRCSLPSIRSEPLGNVSAAVAKGCRFAEFEFDLLKKPDTAFFIPEVESLDVNVGLFCTGVFGVSATGVALSFPADCGGVAEVFNMRGGCVCIVPYAGVWPFILS
jgi:hypothetical protein